MVKRLIVTVLFCSYFSAACAMETEHKGEGARAAQQQYQRMLTQAQLSAQIARCENIDQRLVVAAYVGLGATVGTTLAIKPSPEAFLVATTTLFGSVGSWLASCLVGCRVCSLRRRLADLDKED